jgi:hypothetical protein
MIEVGWRDVLIAAVFLYNKVRGCRPWFLLIFFNGFCAKSVDVRLGVSAV